MALLQELTNQGRVVGGHLATGAVIADQFGKGALSIQHPLNPFKRHKISDETVLEWEELIVREGVTGAISQAAAKAALPGVVGKAVGAGLGAVVRTGHTIRVDWSDGKQSVIELPERLFTIFAALLRSKQVVEENAARPEPIELADAQSGVTDTIVNLASSLIQRRKQSTVSESTPQPDVVEQITKLASLHSAGILTDEEFAQKKAELLQRL
ncbi:SHOCT domain-containing protein [Promicromonospora sp. CA-289599]|uniref:SHOCT domain-containing protein n=1 Tax=Promicromonospora sp. CA-289599 TaxID=3240014 RepID=UPI003D910F0E